MKEEMFAHHKFEEIKMNLHEDILHAYETAKNVLQRIAEQEDKDVPRFLIGGGCVSDHYMGREFRDIDLFIEYETWMRRYEEEIGAAFHTDIKIINSGIEGSEYSQFDIVMMGKSGKGTKKVELLFCPNLQCVYDFDFRFRQFYLYQGKVYVTKGAIKDITEKKLVLESPTTPFTTFVRGEYFQKEIGFYWEEESYRELCWFLSKMTWIDEGMVEEIKHHSKYTNEFIEHLEMKIGGLWREGYVRFPEVNSVFYPEFEDFIANMRAIRSEKKVIQEDETSKFGLLYSDMKECSLSVKEKKEVYEMKLTEKEKKELFLVLMKEWEAFYYDTRFTFLYDPDLPKEVLSVFQKWGKCLSQKKYEELYQEIKKEKRGIINHLLFEFERYADEEKGYDCDSYIEIFDVCMQGKLFLEKEKGFSVQYEVEDFLTYKTRYRTLLQIGFSVFVNGDREIQNSIDERKNEVEFQQKLFSWVFQKIKKDEVEKNREEPNERYKDMYVSARLPKARNI